MLADQMNSALQALTGAVNARKPGDARQEAINAARAAQDLRLRHKPPAEIDIARMKLWVRQLLVDARAKKTGAVAGDVAALEWIWDRIAHIAGKPSAKRVETQLKALRAAGDDEDLTAASEAVSGLSTVLDGLQSS